MGSLYFDSKTKTMFEDTYKETFIINRKNYADFIKYFNILKVWSNQYIEDIEKIYGKNHINVASSLLDLAELELSSDESKEEVTLILDRALDIYADKLGTDHPGEPDHDSGVLHIVHRPPHTGLDDRRLLAHVPGLRQRTPTGASGWADVRDIGFEMLVERLRETVLTTAQHVDQLDCTQFARCHALYAASVVLDGQAAGGFGGGDGETWRERADKCVDAKATNLLWLDADDDGAVDSGETGAAGGTLADFTRSLWTSDSTNFDSTEWTVASGVRRGVRDDR